jgi:hypothetical protein
MVAMKSSDKTVADSYRQCVEEIVPEIKWEDIRDQVPVGQEFSVALACIIFRRLKKRKKGNT